MYKMIFLSDNGQKFVFGTDNANVFDADLGDGVTVDIGTSQGFSQIGETIESRTVEGAQFPSKALSTEGILRHTKTKCAVC